MTTTLQNVKYAGFGMRMLASVIDSILSAFVLLPFFSVFQKIYKSDVQVMVRSGEIRVENLDPVQMAELLTAQLTSFTFQNMIMAIVIIIFWCYRSATPGKMVLKMKIVDAKTGGHPTTRQFIVRYLGYIVSFLPFALGFIWIYYDKRRQGWHDKMAGTVVVVGSGS